MGFAAKIKNIIGLEGNFKDFIKPAAGYTCANITLGGAGYPINQFHQQYLTYVEGLDTAQAGSISLITGLFDAFNDPVMGMITDRTRSRFGRHRPYLLFALIPFCLAYLMKWSSFGVSSHGSGATWTWYLMAGLIYSIGYTMASIPHTAMLPQVAPHYFQRTQYKIVEYLMNSVGQISSYVFTALALSSFNVKTALTALPTPEPEHRNNYMMIGIILTLWFAWPLILCFFKTKEPSSLGQPKEPLNIRYLLNEYRLVFSNRAFRQYFVITMFYSLSRNFYSITDQYFIISVADQYNFFNSFIIISGIAEFCGAPLNYLLVRYKQKTFCGKLLGPLMILGLFMNVFINPTTPAGVTQAIIVVSMILYNFGFSGPGFVGENIQPDVTDVDEMITGRRREGVVSTFKSLFSKTISSLTSYIVGRSLKDFGYDPQVKAPSAQRPLTIFGLKLNFAILPSLFALCSVLAIYAYSMNKKDHELMKQIIAERHEYGRVITELSAEQIQKLEKISGRKWREMWISTVEAREPALSEV